MSSHPIPRIDQLGYVVKDIHAALDHWVNHMKVGPFFLNERSPLLDFSYRGKPSDGKLDIASSYLGDMQIELIGPCDHEPSAFRDFLDAGYEGLHHLGYMTERFEEDLAACEAAGMTYVQGGQSALEATTRFCYVAGDAPVGAMIELVGIGPKKRALFNSIAKAAANWDGRDPIRPLSAAWAAALALEDRSASSH